MSWMRIADFYEEYKTLIRVVFFVTVLLVVLMGGLLVNTARKTSHDHEEIRVIHTRTGKPPGAAPATKPGAEPDAPPAPQPPAAPHE